MNDVDPFPPARIAALASCLAEAGLSELEIATGAATLRLRVDPHFHADAVDAPALDAAPARAITVVSRSIGRVSFTGPGAGWRCPEPGDAVQAGGIVALLRADELLFPVCSPVAGRLGRRLVQEGALVGYGQPVAALA